MAYTFKRSILIHAPIEQVYDELLNIEAHKDWGDLTELELLDHSPIQVGSRWRSQGHAANTVMHDECTVSEMERPHLFTFQVKSRSERATANLILSYRLEPVPEGTQLTFSREFGERDQDLPLMFRVILSIPGIMPLMDNIVTAKIVDRGMVRLRDKIEQTSTAKNPLMTEQAQNSQPAA